MEPDNSDDNFDQLDGERLDGEQLDGEQSDREQRLDGKNTKDIVSSNIYSTERLEHETSDNSLMHVDRENVTGLKLNNSATEITEHESSDDVSASLDRNSANGFRLIRTTTDNYNDNSDYSNEMNSSTEIKKKKRLFLTPGDFRCEMCPKTFHLKSSLQRHLKNYPDHNVVLSDGETNNTNFISGTLEHDISENSMVLLDGENDNLDNSDDDNMEPSGTDAKYSNDSGFCASREVKNYCPMKKKKRVFLTPGAFKCGICLKTFHLKGSLQRHLKSHSSKLSLQIDKLLHKKQAEMENSSVLEEADRETFESQESVNTCESEESDVGEELDKNCANSVRIKQEPDNYDSSGSESCDSEEQSEARPIDSPGTKTPTGLKGKANTDRPRVPCRFCHLTFSRNSNRRDHEDKYHMVAGPGEGFKCDICDRIFPNALEARRHQRDHEEKAFECPVCNVSVTKSCLGAHIRSHNLSKPYRCEYCEKQFNSRKDKVTHERVHTGDKPFECELCQKTFRQLGHLKEHMRVHSDDKPYVCDQCSQAFKRLGELRFHRRTHLENLGDLPVCHICHMVLRCNSKLERHLLGHERRQKIEAARLCNICGETFPTKRKLRSHIKVHEKRNKKNKRRRRSTSKADRHTGIKKASQNENEPDLPQKIGCHLCGVCGAEFEGRFSLEEHLQLHSTGDISPASAVQDSASSSDSDSGSDDNTPTSIRIKREIIEPHDAPSSINTNGNKGVLEVNNLSTFKESVKSGCSTVIKVEPPSP